MSDVVDLSAERSRRDAPDPEHVRQDEYGRPLYRFAIDYTRADGGRFSVDVWAYDWADAQAHADGMGAGCTVAGQIHSVIPA